MSCAGERGADSAAALLPAQLHYKNAAIDALQAQVDELQRDNDRFRSEAQTAMRQRPASQETHGDVLLHYAILQQVLEYVGPDEYLFSAGINRKCKQMQIMLSHRAAAADGRTTDKLRTSFAACISSSKRLLWASDCALKHKKHKEPCQLVEAVLETSADPAKVLTLLNVRSFKAEDAVKGANLCVKAAKRGDLELLQWLRAHDCAWDERTCSEAAYAGHLDIVIWAHENGCPWEHTPAPLLLRAAACTYYNGHVRMDVLGTSALAPVLLTLAASTYCSWRVRTAVLGMQTPAA
jgi:hypothetical protein